jgi:hypothetical protein
LIEWVLRTAFLSLWNVVHANQKGGSDYIPGVPTMVMMKLRIMLTIRMTATILKMTWDVFLLRFMKNLFLL